MFRLLLLILFSMLAFSCARLPVAEGEARENIINPEPLAEEEPNDPIVIAEKDITIKKYFSYMDSIVAQYDTMPGCRLTEHILARANSWIIDTLANTDYYVQKQRGNFIYDQRDMVVLRKGDTLRIPDAATAVDIQNRLHNTVIDVNIPEFKLRIIERDTVKYTFSVRVGRNENKFLKTAKRMVSLQTPIGAGEIVRIERTPIFVNPVTGERYTTTKRDDDQYTMMPQIPWLEPAIGGRRLGSLIHPTTNPKTLGKAYSNGCVGTGEGDAWRIYYHAPVGTKVIFRYDLDVIDEEGKPIQLRDIYGVKRNNLPAGTTSLNAENAILQFADYSSEAIGHDIAECH